MFAEAAERLNVRLLYATDRCDQLEDPWADGAIPVRFYQEASTVQTIVNVAEQMPVAGILAVGDRPTVAAAFAARLLGLPGNSPEAARAARDKRLTRQRLREAGLPTPEITTLPRSSQLALLALRVEFPVVVKPAVLSGSRGVIRADSYAELTRAFDRVSRLLAAADVRELRDPAADEIIIESYIPGREFALEGVLEHGQLRTLAIFDKPDPLEGPFFEETIYVTPSSASEGAQAAISCAIADAAQAIGLHHGPVHAECRLHDDRVFVIEVAARPIGGLCARSLQFVGPNGAHAGLEELLLRHAIGESLAQWTREPLASGVMMIPIPLAGVYRGVAGVEAARQVPGVTDVQITAKTDQQLVPLPEGSSYLGFIFARAQRPETITRALREAHESLEFSIDRALPLV
jgi:biotin carboxylase